MKPCIDGGPGPPREGTTLREGRPIVKYRDTLRSSVRNRLNRSRCHSGCGLGRSQKNHRWGPRGAEGRCMATNFGRHLLQPALCGR